MQGRTQQPRKLSVRQSRQAMLVPRALLPDSGSGNVSSSNRGLSYSRGVSQSKYRPKPSVPCQCFGAHPRTTRLESISTKINCFRYLTCVPVLAGLFHDERSRTTYRHLLIGCKRTSESPVLREDLAVAEDKTGLCGAVLECAVLYLDACFRDLYRCDPTSRKAPLSNIL